MTSNPVRRLFRTVLFTDIVGSTQLAAELGDKRWRRAVAAHHTAVRRELKRHHGREVDTAGDGFFAIFENPTDAVRCAAACIAAVNGLGLKIRAGVHTGEVEPAGGKFGGIAVHIGARLLSQASPQEVIVSSTLRDLVAGSGHEFEDRGIHELKGVPGEWHLYSLVLPRLDEGAAVIGVEDDELRADAVRRQRLLTLGLVAVIAVLVLGLGTAFILLSKPAALPRGPNTIAAYATSGGDPLRGIAIDRGPTALAFGDGVAWSANMDAGTVSRINWSSGAMTGIGQAGRRPWDVALTPGRVWVADRYSGQVALMDASQGALLDTFALHASAIGTGDGQVWFADDLNDRIVRLDPQSGAQMTTIDLEAPAGPTDIAVAGGVVWIAAPRSNTVLRLDPGSAEVTDLGLPLVDVRTVAATGNDVWLASPSTDIIARLDAASGRIAVQAVVCDTPIAVAPTPTGAWVACALDRQLWRLDLAGAITVKITLDAVPSALAVDGETALVTLRAD
jgi:hypothetical protein